MLVGQRWTFIDSKLIENSRAARECEQKGMEETSGGLITRSMLQSRWTFHRDGEMKCRCVGQRGTGKSMPIAGLLLVQTLEEFILMKTRLKLLEVLSRDTFQSK